MLSFSRYLMIARKIRALLLNEIPLKRRLDKTKASGVIGWSLEYKRKKVVPLGC